MWFEKNPSTIPRTFIILRLFLLQRNFQMTFKILMTLRKVFFSITMLGFFVWHSDHVPAGMALLAVLNEVALLLYLFRAFDRVRGEVIAKDEAATDDKLATKNYEIRFERDGMLYTFPHQDSVLGSTINGNTSVPLMVHKGQPPMVFIDTFSHRYLYLIVSLFLLWSVYSMYKGGDI